MIVKIEEKPKTLYTLPRLLPLGQKIYDFCQKFPAVIFNAPPDYQEEFQKQYSKQIADTEHDHSSYLERSGEFFYQNKPINDFLERIEADTYLMFSVMGRDLVTIVTKMRAFYSNHDIPKSCRVDFRKTKGLEKHIGGIHVWSGHILAATIVSGLKKEMVIWIQTLRFSLLRL